MEAIITIDTSTTVCSVALVTESECLAYREDTSGNNHSKVIGVFVKEILAEAKRLNADVRAVALSKGPGSYTGLRIGTSFAKGLCYGMDIKLIAIPTLKIMAAPVAQMLKERGETDSVMCPMIDARRMEVYNALYDMDLNEVLPTAATIIDADSFSEHLSDKKIYFFGNGSGKCKETIVSPNAVFLEGVAPLAVNMREMAFEAYNNNRFEDVAYFEPFYLKEFIATKSKGV
ncbi:MAG: tRNA (adenosine(37)-N6)-threonylcarbamoyltransferase complex dimerization subunit type 1 TsaB [Paludibacteraceae bacterium]|nr:tRNA (adenosine(37)-N6)-threonylcarbamoyltransferase complex dimerization subunit type 1 TsaB [Paludibacteraceae bacterium]